MKLNILALKTISKRLCSDSAKSNAWKPVIGLEIHAQIKANSKLFSNSGTLFGVPPNSQVSLFDASLPGTLPVLNKKCVEEVLKTALALNSKINKNSTFDRKHYFYADLPTGFQITQQSNPIATGGYLKYLYKSVNKFGKPIWVEKRVNLIQIQLEQDSGKSLHDTNANVSLIDLNRAGVGLMEIITEPNFSSSVETVEFVKELQLILQTIDSCEAKMEEGGLRVDASVSVHKQNEPFGVRTEIKNLNSLKSLSKAIDFEIERQIKILENGGKISNDTLSFNIDTCETKIMRDKEKLHDYRFMPEPNLLPLIIDDLEEQDISKDLFLENVNMDVSSDHKFNLDLIARSMPELPQQCRERIISQYNLTLDQAFLFTSMPYLLDIFEQCLKGTNVNSRIAANFFCNEILFILNENSVRFEESGIATTHILDILKMLDEKKISLLTSKEVLKLLIKDPNLNVESIVLDHGWNLISDADLLRSVCINVIENNPEVVKVVKQGKNKALNFLIGQVQMEMKGQADGKIITEIFNELINKNL